MGNKCWPASDTQVPRMNKNTLYWEILNKR